ncbi:hypothetical protein K474DRAFT_1595352 [Panus rudis PR-1116 ss-1]|nr:hypothetical protein K474DRAFT_1595352 [Panus rudis PR-1116 ss-1]
MDSSCLALAMFQKQVVLVQITRIHRPGERYLDVETFIPLGHRTFLAPPVPQARIPSQDLLSIFPTTDIVSRPEPGMLVLSSQAFSEYLELSRMVQKKYERLFAMLSARR